MMEEGEPKLPFNDYKHIPSRPEIDLVLGMESAILLKRFEELLLLAEPRVNWGFHWYDDGGWGYRASWGERVLCVLHFYRGYYAVTLGVPLDKEKEFLALKGLNAKLRAQFTNFELSPKMKWMNFNIRTKEDAEGAAALTVLKLKDLKEKAGR
jgi:hypothetical protein